MLYERSPGRIVEAFIQDFSALGEAGNLHVIVQNTGSYTADYEVILAVVDFCRFTSVLILGCD